MATPLGMFVHNYIEAEKAKRQKEAKARGIPVSRIGRYSLPALAEEAGISPSVLSRLTRKDNYSPQVETLDKLSKAMNVDLHALVEVERGRPVPEVEDVYGVAQTVTQKLRGRYQEQALGFLNFLLMEQERDDENEALKSVDRKAK